MKTHWPGPDSALAVEYLRERFRPSDRLAVVLLNRRTQTATELRGSVEQITGPDFQTWLRDQNGRRREVYVSMNPRRANAYGTTQDVAAIRHLYLHFNENGTTAMESLLKRRDLPTPNYVISSCPNKWLVVWRVNGFEKTQAETLQKSLARDAGADPATTDCTRLVRWPGFYNHKYSWPHLVRAERVATETYCPKHFPKLATKDRAARTAVEPGGARRSGQASERSISQSERDWTFAKHALELDEPPALIVAAIASYRRFDKADPECYAALTVTKAQEALKAE